MTKLKTILCCLLATVSACFGTESLHASVHKKNKTLEEKLPSFRGKSPHRHANCILKKKKNDSSDVQCFDHTITLQLFDNTGFPVEGTQFGVKLKIRKEGNRVNITFPTINFQTGQDSASAPFEQLPGIGGMLRAVGGFLPENVWPSNPNFLNFIVASNNGESSVFTYLNFPPDFPVIPSGYILTLTDFGGLEIQGTQNPYNYILAGPQVMLPTSITYYREEPQKLNKNKVLSCGASNVTQWTGLPSKTRFRDTHVNDAFDNVLGWAWTDNSNQDPQSNNVSNAVVSIGKVVHGKLKVKPPIQLSNNPNSDGSIIFNTAVAINRKDSQNIVVSWGTGNAPTITYRAVSFDGGKTWPHNGRTNIQPEGPGGAGDNRGVSSDKYGNIWYGTTNFIDASGNKVNQPVWWISPDGGVNFTVAYTMPLPPNFSYGVDLIDYPQYCFGGDGQGNYGLWFAADYYVSYGLGFVVDIVPLVGFIPITGPMSVGGPIPLGPIPSSTPSVLYDLNNTQYLPSLTASHDGRVWSLSYTGGLPIYSNWVLRFKSPPNSTYPDPVTSNYSGPWQLAIINNATGYQTQGFISRVGIGTTVQSTLYDEKRQALYALLEQSAPDLNGTSVPLAPAPFVQNIRLFLMISRDNGQTFSEPFYISSSNFANRGFQSMALDEKTGNLVFGWYDGRNDPTYQSVEYFGAVLPAKQLDKMVESIKPFDPLFISPPATGTPPALEDLLKQTQTSSRLTYLDKNGEFVDHSKQKLKNGLPQKR